MCATQCPDGDGDGFTDSSCGGADCDDTRPDVHPNATELCTDGIDNNCNNLTDNQDAASCAANMDCVPNTYDALEYVAEGFLGLSAGAIITSGNQWWYWLESTKTVSETGSLKQLWDKASPLGSQPPTTGIDAIAFTPAGRITTNQGIVVAAGSTLYVYDVGSPWVSHTISDVAPVSNIDAMTLYPVDGFWNLVVVRSGLVHVHGSNGWTGPNGVGTALCPAGSTGPCPANVKALTRWQTSALAVQDNAGLTHVTSLQSPFQWTSGTLSSYMCQ